MQIKPGEEVHGNGDERLLVLDIVPFEDEDDVFVRMLKVEERRRSARRTLRLMP